MLKSGVSQLVILVIPTGPMYFLAKMCTIWHMDSWRIVAASMHILCGCAALAEHGSLNSMRAG